MKIIAQIGLVLGVCLVGEWVSALLPIAFPGSVLSMLLLFLLLLTRALRPDHIQQAADFLLQNMPFFFIPAGAGLLEHWDAIRASVLPLLVVCVVTTVLTFGAAGLTVKAVIALQQRQRGKRHAG